MFIPKWGEHADKAKRRHDITETQIAHAWTFGLAEPTRDNCWRIIGEEVTLVVSADGEFIITMYPNKYNDRHTSKLAEWRAKQGKMRGALSNGKIT